MMGRPRGDAIDLPIPWFLASKFYTDVRHVAMSNHVLSVVPLLGSKRKIEALPAGLQRIVRDEGRALVPAWRAAAARQIAGDVQGLKASGVAFTEIQFAAFRKAVEPVYGALGSKFGGDLIERVMRAAGSAQRPQ